MTTDMNSKDMEWLVDSRSNVQNLLLVLWHIAKEEPLSTASLQLQHQLLVATCFALWRAVFLAHGERTTETITTHATKFLETLVRDNMIGYTQDRESKAWTFGYYVNDAFFRLEYYHKTFHKLSEPHASRVTAYLVAQSTENGGELDAHLEWTHAYEAALDAAKKLADAI
jgi:hypothetical protein